jgi:hypothetical protein
MVFAIGLFVCRLLTHVDYWQAEPVITGISAVPE